MDSSNIVKARQHEIQYLLIALDKLGKNFGTNKDLYYNLGQYVGYNEIFFNVNESKNDPLS